MLSWYINRLDGATVDSASGMGDIAHVYVENDLKYSDMLVKIDLNTNKNSRYTLQLLESDAEDPRE